MCTYTFRFYIELTCLSSVHTKSLSTIYKGLYPLSKLSNVHNTFKMTSTNRIAVKNIRILIYVIRFRTYLKIIQVRQKNIMPHQRLVVL